MVRPSHLKIVALSVKFIKSLHLAGMAQSPKRRELSLKEKVQLIKASKEKSQRALAEIFKVGKTQVQQILKRKAVEEDVVEIEAKMTSVAVNSSSVQTKLESYFKH